MSKITDDLQRAVDEAGFARAFEGPTAKAIFSEHVALISHLVQAVKALDARLDEAGL